MHPVSWLPHSSSAACPLSEENVHVWRIGEARFSEDFLSVEEREAVQRFKNKDAKEMYVRGRAALRTLVADYVGKSPGELLIRCGEQGKPFFVHEEIEFNATHGKNLLLIAFRRKGALGIDVENGFRLQNPLELAKRYFSEKEVRYLETLSGEDTKKNAFLRLWVCKEAALKSSGQGLAGGLEHTEVELGEKTYVYRRLDEKRLPVVEFTPEEGFQGALVGESPISRENVKWFVLS